MAQQHSTCTWASRLAALVSRRAGARRKRARARLRLEILEDRCVPATITVNSAADTAAPPAGTVTLRSAITQAEADTTADTITFAPALLGQTIIVGGTALPTLTRGEAITGPGAGGLTISANNASRIFNVTSTTPVNISGLTLSGGNTPAGGSGGAVVNSGLLAFSNVTVTGNHADFLGGGIDNEGAGATLTLANCSITSNAARSGGGVYNSNGSVTIINSTLAANTIGANGGGGGLQNAEGTVSITNSTIAYNLSFIRNGVVSAGAGLENSGTMTLTSSTVVGNQSQGDRGGGIENFSGTLVVTNSTIAGNTALGGGGGGIWVSTGNLTVSDSTVTGNGAGTGTASAGGISFMGGGTFTLNNTVVAQNATGDNAALDVRGAVTSGSGNFIGVGDANLTGIANGTGGNQIGSAAAPRDPQLGPLQDNGGPTQTRSPLVGSPLINAGVNGAIAGLATDQRGSLRLVGTAVDIGSVEFQPPALTFTLAVTAGGNAITQVPEGTTVTLTATVTPTSPAPNASPTGTVTVLAGAAVLGTATVGANGVATLTLTNPPIGHLSLTAQYSGDLNYHVALTAVSPLFVVPKFTVGAYDPLLGTWQLRSTNSSGPADAGSFQFGGFGPSGFADGLVGDWQGNGQFTPAVFYPATGTWFLRNSDGPTNALVVPPFQFGGPTTIPIAGDWFKDGHFDVGVYDVITGTFFLRHGTSTGSFVTFQLGGPGFYPVAGDWDGDGTWTVGVVQLSTMTWFLKNSNTAGAANLIFLWGSQNPSGPAVLPVVGDWGGIGKYGIGLVVPVQNQPNSQFNNQDIFLLRNEVNAGFADAGLFVFGKPGDTPVAGQWSLPTNPLSFQLAAGEGPGAAAITQADLGQAVAAALGRLQQAGVSSAVLGQLAAASYQVANLPAGQLGYTAQGVVQISGDGAGHGWFVDLTPGQDEEFSGGLAVAGGAAAGREDLLTVVLHEMAHLIGVNDGGAGLMASVLPTGTRRTDGIDAVFGDS